MSCLALIPDSLWTSRNQPFSIAQGKKRRLLFLVIVNSWSSSHGKRQIRSRALRFNWPQMTNVLSGATGLLGYGTFIWRESPWLWWDLCKLDTHECFASSTLTMHFTNTWEAQKWEIEWGKAERPGWRSHTHTHSKPGKRLDTWRRAGTELLSYVHLWWRMWHLFWCR